MRWLVLLAVLYAVPAQAQLYPLSSDGLATITTDRIRVRAWSRHQETVRAHTTSGSNVLWKIITGTGKLEVGTLLAGTALTGNAGTVTAVSSQVAQVISAGDTTNLSTTIANIPTNKCAEIVANMLVDGTNVVDPGTTPVITTGACSGGSVTISVAATGTATVTLTFTPAAVMSVTADASNTADTEAGYATIIAREVVTLTVGYMQRRTSPAPSPATPDMIAATLTIADVTSDNVVNPATSSALLNGVLQKGAVAVTAGSPDPHAIYVRVEQTRDDVLYSTLACGTVTEAMALDFPGPCELPKPRQRTFTQPRPATGADAKMDVPDGVSHTMKGFQVLGTNSATAGVRFPFMKITDKEGLGSQLIRWGGNAAIAPSEQYFFIAGEGLTDSYDVAGRAFIPGRDVMPTPVSPGAGVQATMSMPDPGDGLRNVVTCIGWSITNTTAAATSILLRLLDGASTVKWHLSVSLDGAVALNTKEDTVCPPRPWVMTPSEATTWQTSAAPSGAGSVQLSMSGYVMLAPPNVQLYAAIPPHRLLGGGGAQFVFSLSNGTVADDVVSEPEWTVDEWIEPEI